MQCGLDTQLWEVPKTSTTAQAKIEEHIRAISFHRTGASVFALSWVSDVVNLQDHSDYLCSQ